ncbi:hypothetical protein Q8F55_004588 [Vanrija albida]|uniref:AB hydrolase-1 domain-containing protein n=1 Tax=Vanrija albida TaxID=181172 RepID=A0ABR3Q749_9TREE
MVRFISYRSEAHPMPTIGIVSGFEPQPAPPASPFSTGHLSDPDARGETVQAATFPDGTRISSLHHLIAAWGDIGGRVAPAGPVERLADVEVLAPLRGRDVLCVGKNYKAHAAEFHNSGFDSSDTKAQPDFPVIFTKRASSIVGAGTEIYPHPGVTETLDYEGELAVIIGVGGARIKKEDAWKHVWGATIVNDVTARERQRDHKQFYIGKSLDTFCPMGPYAVPAADLDWDNMTLETRVNGEVRQEQATNELIFDIPTLIETLSLGITLQPGDVIATGTPLGVCLSTGVFLKPGDRVDVSITGLGTLTNVVGTPDVPPTIASVVEEPSPVPAAPRPDAQLVRLPSGAVHVYSAGSGAPTDPTVVFLHGLGGWHANFFPIISRSGVERRHRVLAFDLPGLGLSPKPTQPPSIDLYVQLLKELVEHAGVKVLKLVGHDLGGLVATTFAARYPDAVTSLLLLSPLRRLAKSTPILNTWAETARRDGLGAIAHQAARIGTSPETHDSRPLALGSITASILSQSAEGFAGAAEALARASDPDYSQIKARTLVVAGAEDELTPKAYADGLGGVIAGARVVALQDVGHWALFEDVAGAAELLALF